MNLVCIGISHHTAPLEIREQLWFSPEEIRNALPNLLVHGVNECVLFSTCNRTEYYAFSAEPVEDPAPLANLLLTQKTASPQVRPSHLFILKGLDAVRHLFDVASGIDSMVIGDVQILAQVKEGLTLAREAGTAGFFLKRLFQASFHAGKRSRSETTIGEGAVSVSYAAVELAERIFENFAEKRALVIGAGETAQLTAKHLRGRNIGSLVITNRTLERAESLARMVGGSVLPFEDFPKRLAEFEIIVSSVSADAPLLSAHTLRNLEKKRDSALFLIDLGVPRNIDPACGDLENVFLYDLDTLQGIASENTQKREREVPRVRQIVAEETENFSRWFSSLHAAPTITALNELVEAIRREEVEKNLNRFDPKDRELLEILTKRIVNKIFHAPIVNLKNGQDETHTERLQKINALRKLFGIEGTKEL